MKDPRLFVRLVGGSDGPMSHRQFMAWTAWLEMEWNRPSRTDQYIMSLTAEVRRILHKNPQKVKLKDFLLKFDGKDVPRKSLSEEEAADFALSKWMGVMGGFGAVRVVDDQGQEYRLAKEEADPYYVIEDEAVADEESE